MIEPQTKYQNDLYFEQAEILKNNPDIRYIYLVGGRWSSKTWGVLQNSIEIKLESPKHLSCIAMKVYDNIKDTIYSDLLTINDWFELKEGIDYDAYVSPLSFKYYNGSKYIFKGLDKPGKAKGLAGVHELIMEEADHFEEYDFEYLDQSIRGQGYARRTWILHNPIPILPGSKHWLQKIFYDRLPQEKHKNFVTELPDLGKVLSCITTYEDNYFVDDHTKKRLEGYKDTNPGLYKLWTLGEFTTVEGVILTKWSVIKEEPDQRLFIGYGLDFGFSNDPAALVKIWINQKERKLYIKPLVYQTGLTSQPLAAKMKQAGVGSLDLIVADSSRPDIIEEIYRFGFKKITGAKKPTGYKEQLANILQGYTIYIVNGEYTTQAKSELSTWSWQKDKHGNQLVKVTDGNDHIIDCVLMRMQKLFDVRPIQKAKMLKMHV